ncbi:MAG: methyltransferase domain-containing protein [Candidatus Tectomicrobia bacterium]|nr:methyltransferase domain-containing protein [Candidatus Tectomicrobia bacterium]
MSSIHEFYHRRYANIARSSPGPEAEQTFHLRVAAALRAMPDPAARVLDFGCGMGAASKRLAAAGHGVVGVDISEPAIQQARSAVPTATFQVIDSEGHVPFPDASFDVCFCTEVIEHLFDVKGFLREMHRLLVRDGLLLMTTPYHGWAKNLLIMTCRFDTHFNPLGGHIRFFSKRSLVHCLQSGCFQVESVRGIGRVWPLRKTMFVKAHKC